MSLGRAECSVDPVNQSPLQVLQLTRSVLASVEPENPNVQHLMHLRISMRKGDSPAIRRPVLNILCRSANGDPKS